MKRVATLSAVASRVGAVVLGIAALSLLVVDARITASPAEPVRPPAGQTPRPEAEVVARSLQRRYDTIKDFTADFTHTYRGGALRTPATERGTMSVKRPDRMRWEYTSPEPKTFVSDGHKMYSYIPEERQVVVTSLPPGQDAPTPVLFLSGRADLMRDFLVSWAEGEPATAYALKLVPRRADADYAALVVRLTPETLQILELTTLDAQGGHSTFAFTNLKENRGVPDKEFTFRIPRGVDVLTDDRATR